jgi:hypothetical protein
MDKLDFKTFDERFQNVPVKVGTEQSEIDNRRDAFIAQNSLTYLPKPVVPSDIKGKPFKAEIRKIENSNRQDLLPILADYQQPETGTEESVPLKEMVT